jgi:hypothetical protein
MQRHREVGSPGVRSDRGLSEKGDAFGFASLERGQFTPIFTLDNSRGPVFVGDDEFYLGVSTSGEGLSVPCCEVRNVFGWVRLKPILIFDPSSFGFMLELEMLENAVAYNSLGIIVGTAEVVPEPTTTALALVAALYFVVRRRRV